MLSVRYYWVVQSWCYAVLLIDKIRYKRDLYTHWNNSFRRTKYDPLCQKMVAIWRTFMPLFESQIARKEMCSRWRRMLRTKKKRKKPKKSTIKCVSWSRSRRCCLLNRIVMFRTSEPYTLEDYCLLFIIDRSQSINYFFWDFDFYRFPISIDNNQRIKSIISHNCWYRFLSINYA